jgi:mRNA-degrading endonuclease RelE of RelBE toxin-antitoxin system
LPLSMSWKPSRTPADSFRWGDMHRLRVGRYRIMYVIEGDLITIERVDRVTG